MNIPGDDVEAARAVADAKWQLHQAKAMLREAEFMANLRTAGDALTEAKASGDARGIIKANAAMKRAECEYTQKRRYDEQKEWEETMERGRREKHSYYSSIDIWRWNGKGTWWVIGCMIVPMIPPIFLIFILPNVLQYFFGKSVAEMPWVFLLSGIGYLFAPIMPVVVAVLLLDHLESRMGYEKIMSWLKQLALLCSIVVILGVINYTGLDYIFRASKMAFRANSWLYWPTFTAIALLAAMAWLYFRDRSFYPYIEKERTDV